MRRFQARGCYYLSTIWDASILPIPDFFDGAPPETVAAKVRKDLNKKIIANKKTGTRVAPNFFPEFRSPGRSFKVDARQAMLDGAYGAPDMHALQNYLLDGPVWDGYACTFSSTLMDGYLKLYAHHLAVRAAPGLPSSFHATLLKPYTLSHEVTASLMLMVEQR